MDENHTTEAGFRAIVEAHRERVRNICFRYVKNSEDADDVAQEVFIQLYESLSRFREESELSTWIYRIAVNKSLDFMRRKKRKKRFGRLTSIFGFGEIGEEIADPSGNTPYQDLEDRERRQILAWVVDKLPDNQKTAIVLSQYEAFHNGEIAAIMDLSLSAVEGLLHRAKRNLRKHLAHYFEQRL